jgi:hypothetical protein
MGLSQRFLSLTFLRLLVGTPLALFTGVYRSSYQMDLRKLAKGQRCMIRLPGCNHDRRTTVLAHYRLAGYAGMGAKPDDWSFGAWACSHCHDIVDGRVKTDHTKHIVRLAHAEGCLRTQAELREMKGRGEL